MFPVDFGGCRNQPVSPSADFAPRNPPKRSSLCALCALRERRRGPFFVLFVNFVVSASLRVIRDERVSFAPRSAIPNPHSALEPAPHRVTPETPPK